MEYEEHGSFKGIEIITEKSHNKFLTKIIGLEDFGFDLKGLRALRDLCKVKYACSISLKEIPGSAKRKQLMKKVKTFDLILAFKEFILHGNFFDEFDEFLRLHLRIDEKYIHKNDKISKKKKQQNHRV